MWIFLFMTSNVKNSVIYFRPCTYLLPNAAYEFFGPVLRCILRHVPLLYFFVNMSSIKTKCRNNRFRFFCAVGWLLWRNSIISLAHELLIKNLKKTFKATLTLICDYRFVLIYLSTYLQNNHLISIPFWPFSNIRLDFIRWFVQLPNYTISDSVVNLEPHREYWWKSTSQQVA